MARTLYAQSSGNWDKSNNWKDAVGGGTAYTPGDGDTCVLQGYTITMNLATIPASGTLAAIDGNSAGGQLQLAMSGSNSYYINATSITGSATYVSDYGAVYVSGAAASAHLYISGSVSGGNSGTQKRGVTHASTGHVHIAGAVQGGTTGSCDNSNGVNVTSTGKLYIGTQGTPANINGGKYTNYALNCSAACTVTAYGNVVATNGCGVIVSAGATVGITGNVTAGGNSCIAVQQSNASANVTITGNVTGGTSSTAYGCYMTAGTLNIAGDITGGAASSTTNHGLYASGGTLNHTVGTASGGASNNSYGIYGLTSATLNINNISGTGSGIGVYVASGSPALTISGNTTGGSAAGMYGIYIASGSTATISIGGTSTAGSNITAQAVFNNSTTSFTVTGNIVNSATTDALCGKWSWQPANKRTNYYQDSSGAKSYQANASDAQYIKADESIAGLTGTYPTTEATTASVTTSVQAADAATLESVKSDLKSTRTVTFGASSVTGTLNMSLYTLISGLVAAGDVRKGVAIYSGGGNGTLVGTVDSSGVYHSSGIITADSAYAANGILSEAGAYAPLAGALVSSGGYYVPVSAANVVAGVSFGVNSEDEGEYPTTAASKAEQLSDDKAAITAAKSSIKDDTTILTIDGTYDFQAAIDAGYNSGYDTGKADQLATDQSDVLSYDYAIKDDVTVIGVPGAYDFTAAIAEGYANGEAAQLVADKAAVDAEKAYIVVGHTILTKAGEYPTSATSEATGAAAQLVIDTAAVTAAKGDILDTRTLLGVTGTLDMDGYVILDGGSGGGFLTGEYDLGESLVTHAPAFGSVNRQLYVADGWQKTKVWDGVSEGMEDAGIESAPQDWNPTPASESGSVAVGDHLIRYRYKNSVTGYVSDASNIISYSVVSSPAKLTFGVDTSGADNIVLPDDTKANHIVVEMTTAGGTTFFEAADVEITDELADISVDISDDNLAEFVLDYDDYGHGVPPYSNLLCVHKSRLFATGVPIHEVGTATVTNGDKTVTLNLASLTDCVVGRRFAVDGDTKSYTIATYTSTTEFELTEEYAGTSGSGKGYSIFAVNPNVVWYSKAMFPESFAPESWFVAFDGVADTVSAIVPNGDEILIFGQHHIERFLYIDNPAEGTLYPCADERGALNAQCVVRAHNQIYVFDRLGFYQWSCPYPTPIGEPVSEMLPDVNWAEYEQFHGIYSPSEKVIRWFYCSGTDTVPRNYFEFDLVSLTWSTGSIAAGVTSSCSARVDDDRKVIYGDTYGNMWIADTGTTDGVLNTSRTTGTVAATSTSSVIKIAGGGLYASGDKLSGVELYWKEGNQSRIIDTNTATDITLKTAFSSTPMTGDTMYIGRRAGKLKTKAIPLGSIVDRNEEAYLHLFYVPESNSRKGIVRVYENFSGTAKSDYAASTDRGITYTAASANIEFDLNETTGHARIPLGAAANRVVEVEVEFNQPDSDVRLIGVVVGGAAVAAED